MVDTQGTLIAGAVTAANLSDQQGLYLLLDTFRFTSVRKIWADMGFQGQEAKAYAARHKADLEIVSRRSPKSFVVQAKRWIVERTFAWLGRFRRMSKDYEYRVCSSVSMMYIAMARLLLKRLGSRCLNC